MVKVEDRNCDRRLETRLGKCDSEGTSLIWLTGNGDIPPMGPGNGPGEAQTQTDAGL